jgi:gamma-glutamylcyclotransferase (GGCT)/AIG2-like uncharacterized protein YtfP
MSGFIRENDGKMPTEYNFAHTRLASYGTLAPGKINHHQLDGLEGNWTSGTIRGRLVTVDRGVHKGLIGLVIDEGAEPVPVQIFHSADLPAHWDRLDAFEGELFRRVVATISTDDGTIEASLYKIMV